MAKTGEGALMGGATSEAGSTAAGAAPDKGLPAISALVVDVASANRSQEQQAAVTGFIWHMLERDYQIYICSSSARQGADPLAGESFAHPRLTWLHAAMPPGEALLARHPALAAATTLWISDDERVLEWVRQRGLAFVSMRGGTASFAADLPLAGWGELALLLDPTAQAVRQVAEAIAELRQARGAAPVVVGIGGPPESGFERFALELKRELEAHDAPLVELLDLSSFLAREDEGPARKEAPHGFPATAADEWLMQNVVEPLAAGEEVYVAKAPPGLPEEFRDRFPLYVGAGSVVLLLGETVFRRALREAMRLAILVEVAPREIARRLYEIPEGEKFDDSFTAQYLERDGRPYEEYLKEEKVVAQADIRIDATSPRKFELLPVGAAVN